MDTPAEATWRRPGVMDGQQHPGALVSSVGILETVHFRVMHVFYLGNVGFGSQPKEVKDTYPPFVYMYFLCMLRFQILDPNASIFCPLILKQQDSVQIRQKYFEVHILKKKIKMKRLQFVL